MLKKIALTIGAAAVVAGATAAGPGLTPPVSIADVIERSGGKFDKNGNDYDFFLNALIYTGQLDLLNEPSDLTLFAPNDNAFIFLAKDLGYTRYDEYGAWNFLLAHFSEVGGGDPLPALEQLIQYHLVGESLTRANLRELARNNQTINTLSGDTIAPRSSFRLEDSNDDFRDARITAPSSTETSNGVIHPVNRVMLPFELN